MLMTDSPTFGLRLRVARDAAGLKQHNIANALGISSSAIARYEQDLDVPKDERTKLLAGVLGVSASWLRFGEGEGPEITHDPRVRRPTSEDAQAE